MQGDAGSTARLKFTASLSKSLSNVEQDQLINYENRACDKSSERKAIIAVSLHDAGDETNEGGRGATDLETAAADERDDQAARDRRVKTALG